MYLRVLLLGEEDDKDDVDLGEVLRYHVLERIGAERMTVHACDLGPADNEMGYGPYTYLESSRALRKSSHNGGGVDQPTIRIRKWHNDLRKTPWEQLGNLPDRFPSYESKYCEGSAPAAPVSVPRKRGTTETATMIRLATGSDDDDNDKLPSADNLYEMLVRSARLDPERCRDEQNTGLYGTHWGGLSPETVAEAKVLETVRAYAVECQENDRRWFEHPSYVGRKVRRNGLSLEHAAMQWQLLGDRKHPVGDSNNWLPGESLVRYLSAPLLLGTVSPRRIWHAARPEGFLFCQQSPLKRLVEAREWHRLLAARNLRYDPAYQGQAETTYKYWRYQGFLVRYAETNFASSSSGDAVTATAASAAARGGDREGVLLVHGFGASGAQWNKAMHHLSSACSDPTCQGLAPDLLGFGHSEKPSLSYTAYLWDSMTSDLVKEVAIPKNGWTSFVVGGNSIGGFTSMSMAASDTAVVGGRQATSSGAPGTGRCTGLVLMNSAGPAKTRQEVENSLVGAKDLQLMSVAQVTALNGLPPCRPPPRPVARVFGNGLLAYLRPSIQSICKNLYPTNPSAVDDKLCDDIARDSLDPGAIYVMMAGAKLPAPRTANELLQADFGSALLSSAATAATARDQVRESAFAGPVLIAQGVLDPLNDAMDRMRRFGALRRGITMDPIQAGHCPHDELPKEVASSIARWMSATTAERATKAPASGVVSAR
jgi:pimeloyl-ACP methyl ester carboxylesterase